jgi:hypothetical protein
MIFFGTKSVVRAVGGGLRVTRPCGKCRGVSELVEHSARRYFTLYFVPVLPIGAAERVLRCTRCEATYLPTPEDYARVAPSSGSDPDVIQCPYCRQQLRVPKEPGGSLKLRCKVCRGEFDIAKRRNE